MQVHVCPRKSLVRFVVVALKYYVSPHMLNKKYLYPVDLECYDQAFYSRALQNLDETNRCCNMALVGFVNLNDVCDQCVNMDKIPLCNYEFGVHLCDTFRGDCWESTAWACLKMKIW